MTTLLIGAGSSTTYEVYKSSISRSRLYYTPPVVYKDHITVPTAHVLDNLSQRLDWRRSDPTAS